MQEIKLIDAPSQTFSVRINQKKVGFHFKYNTYTDRWTFDMAIDDVPVLYGRKVVVGSDLLRPFVGYGIGLIFAVSTPEGMDDPNRDNIPSGVVRIFQATEEEVAGAAP